jgi:WD40 repeat protein
MLILSGHRGRVHTLAFSPDGVRLASVAGHDSRVWLWDLATARTLAHAPHERRVVSLAFAPGERKTLAFADSSGTVRLWDPDSGKLRSAGRVYPAPSQAVKVAFSPSGDLLAATGAQETHRDRYWWQQHYGLTVWEWESDSGGEILARPLRPLTSLAFSPDGSMVAAGSLDRTVYLWDVEKRRQRGNLNHGRKVHFLTYSPDGRTLASATPDGLVKVWDAETGRGRTTLKGHVDHLHAMAYSPDGCTLVTAAGDGNVRFWDVDTGRPRHAFDWGVGAVHSVAFSPDGMRAAAGGDQDIVVWDIDDWG